MMDGNPVWLSNKVFTFRPNHNYTYGSLWIPSTDTNETGDEELEGLVIMETQEDWQIP